jgi:hypothetical protein
LELINFEWPWCPDGYELRGNDIIPASDNLELADPMRFKKCIYRTFVDAEPTPEGAITFATAFGLLLDEGSMSLEDWKQHHAEMVSVWKSWQAGDWEGLMIAFNRTDNGVIQTKIAADPDNISDIRLVLEPPNLLQMMWVEMALHAINHVGLRSCEWCGSWFSYGTGTNRRNTAKFCSDKCRKASHLSGKEDNNGQNQ